MAEEQIMSKPSFKKPRNIRKKKKVDSDDDDHAAENKGDEADPSGMDVDTEGSSVVKPVRC